MAFFPHSFLDDIRSRTSVSDVVGQVVRLKPKGRGEFTGLCPFHKEKTPSFTVSDDKGFYHCFGCGAHGDVFTFLTKQRGLAFNEAVKQLASEAGLALPEQSPQAQQEEAKRLSQLEVMEKATEWFSQQLRLPANQEVQSYITSRKLSEQTVAEFRLGFAPDGRDALYQHLKSLNVSDTEMDALGLVHITPGKPPLDRFRGRLMFPIADDRGRVIAFGGRILGDGQPKYLNSPETDLFKKSQVLYGWNLARTVAYKKKAVVIVEGYMDVIALHQAGILNAVAPLGTAITEPHLQKLWKVTEEPVLCLDGDNAGFRAMQRTADLALPLLKPGNSLKFAFLPKGLDPDDYIAEHGVAALRDVLVHASPLSQVLWQLTWEESPATTPEARAQKEKELFELATRIEDRYVSQQYRQFFINKLNEERQAKRSHKAVGKRSWITDPEKTSLSQQEKQVANILFLIARFPSLLLDVHNEEFFLNLDTQHIALSGCHDALSNLLQSETIVKNEVLTKETLEKYGLHTHMEKLKSLNAVDRYLEKIESLDTAEKEWEFFIAKLELEQLNSEYAGISKALEVSTEEDTYEKMLQIKQMLNEQHQKLQRLKHLREDYLEAS